MENFDYENSLKRLEEIAATLEKGEISREKMTELYVEGSELIKKCTKVLENAQLKITEISGDSRNE